MSQAKSDAKGPVGTWNDFDRAMLAIQRDFQPGDDTPRLEVSDDFFKVLCKDSGSPHAITYGSRPGVMIVRHGHEADIDRELKMPLDQFYIESVERAKKK